jgi:hypothetical protein
MKLLSLNKKIVYVFLVILLSSCSSLSIDKEKISNILSWESDTSEDFSPKNSIQFECAENKVFYLRYLEEKNAVWIILDDREFRLEKILDQDNKFSNSMSNLEINPENTILNTSSKTSYEQCKEKIYIKD